MAETSNDGREQMPVALDWSGAADVPIHPVNVFLVQGSPLEIVVTLGLAAPPVQVAHLSGEETTRYLAENLLSIQYPVRLVLPPSAAESLGKALVAYATAGRKGDEETQ